jgi:5,5'-dehydrodivanillate O-demethylase
MLNQEANDRLTRVGPGTPCGALMRRYWIPFAALSQLDDDPVRRVRLLGEDLILFRNRQGGLGLIGDRCLHRSVDMKLGIPDDEGLRCPYHGWLYDSAGACIERPLEARPRGKFSKKMTAYPVRELGGMLFAYMGAEPAPALPPWDLFVWPNAVRQIAINVLPCNWLQCQENTGDPTHSIYAHGHWFKYILERQGRFEERAHHEQHTLKTRLKWQNGIKEIYANGTDYGMEKGIVYSEALGAEQDAVRRHSTVIFPFYTQIGVGGAPRSEFQIRVPMDDTQTLHLCYQVYSAPPGVEAPEQDGVGWYEPPLFDEKGEPILDFVLAQDAMLWQAQGEVTDRSQENLGRTDVPIVFLRRQLEEQISRVEQGLDPLNYFPELPDNILYGNGAPTEEWTAPDWAERQKQKGKDGMLSGQQFYRSNYHKGFAVDDVDRYGPAVDLVKELHRRIEEAQIAATA